MLNNTLEAGSAPDNQLSTEKQKSRSKKPRSGLKSQLQQVQGDLDMYKQLFNNSERKRARLCEDVVKMLAQIDKEKDPNAHEKAEELKALMKEKYGRAQPGGAERTSRLQKLEKEIDSLQIMLSNE